MTNKALAALMVAALLVLQVGCGRKGRPEPRRVASDTSAAARHDIALSR